MWFVLWAVDDFNWRDGFNYGVPTGLLLIVMFALWRGGLWLRDNVVKPVVAAHLRTVETFNDQLPRQTVELAKQTAVLEHLKGLASSLPAQTESLLEIKMAIKNHSSWSAAAVKDICKAEAKGDQ